MQEKQILQKAFEQTRAGKDSGLNIKALAGDASLRQYLRVEGDFGKRILMLVEPFQAAQYNFLLVRDLLANAGIPVPGLCAVDDAKGAILLEDLTDRTMLHVLGECASIDEEMAEYRRALDLLVSFHSKVKPASGMDIEGFRLAFDEEKLMWEVDFTLEHLFKSYLKRPLSPRDHQAIRESFADICRRIAAEPRVFTHRDYHSRNLMIPSSGVYTCIDFQDARMGLRQYDLASILRDSYYQLDAEKVYELVEYYRKQAEKSGAKLPAENFTRMFDLMSVQRNFKAIGSFTSFFGKRGDTMYIRFVGNTFENIRKNLLKFPEYTDLRKSLFGYYYF